MTSSDSVTESSNLLPSEQVIGIQSLTLKKKKSLNHVGFSGTFAYHPKQAYTSCFQQPLLVVKETQCHAKYEAGTSLHKHIHYGKFSGIS